MPKTHFSDASIPPICLWILLYLKLYGALSFERLLRAACNATLSERFVLQAHLSQKYLFWKPSHCARKQVEALCKHLSSRRPLGEMPLLVLSAIPADSHRAYIKSRHCICQSQEWMEDFKMPSWFLLTPVKFSKMPAPDPCKGTWSLKPIGSSHWSITGGLLAAIGRQNP